MNNQSTQNKDMQEPPRAPVYDEGELKPSDAYDEDGTTTKRLQFLAQETEKVINPLTLHYTDFPDVPADARLLKRVENFLTWFAHSPVAVGLEQAVRRAYEPMHRAEWPSYFRNKAYQDLYACEHFRWSMIDAINKWPGTACEEWETEIEDKPLDDSEPEAHDTTPKQKQDFYQFTTCPDRYGHNGLVPGQMFANQKAAVEHGAHAEMCSAGVGAGCRSGAGTAGAYSVIIADTYGAIDEDQGDVILYAGTGALQSEDPDKMHRGNKWLSALRRSASNKNSPPVRVLRKCSTNNAFAPTRGPETSLRYDGLYKVVSFRGLKKKDEQGNRTKGMYEEFRLERVEPGNDEVQGTLAEAQKHGETVTVLPSSTRLP